VCAQRRPTVIVPVVDVTAGRYEFQDAVDEAFFSSDIEWKTAFISAQIDITAIYQQLLQALSQDMLLSRKY
jgi:hypothetical protein